MPVKRGKGFQRGHVPHQAQEARRDGEEEVAVSAAGAGVGDVSTVGEGKKMDDVAATPF
jgi:hypothetical protein